MEKFKKIASILIFLLLISSFITGCSNNKNRDSKVELTISAAASLKESLDEIKSIYESENNVILNINYGGSGTLVKQVIEGAPVDIIFLADKKRADELDEKSLLEKDYSSDFLSNTLTVIKSDINDNTINSLEDLSSDTYSIAIGNPESVPVGKYSKEALEKVGIWDQISSDLILAKDVKSVAQYVENGSVDFGIVYNTDAKVLKTSKVVYEVPEDLHSDVVYNVSVINTSNNIEESKKFYEYIGTEEALNIFKKYGFKINE